MHSRVGVVGAAVVSLGLSACGGAQTRCGDSRDESAEATAGGEQVGAPGRFQAGFVERARAADNAFLVRVRIAADGAIEKTAIYHRDASQIPEAIQALALARFPGSTVINYESEYYADAGEVAEVEVRAADGRECEVSALLDGTFRYIECKIDPSALPEVVRSAALARVPGGRIDEAEMKTLADESTAYSVELVHLERVHYVRLDAAGTVLSHTLRLPATIEVPVD